jgi:hypothetical protein
MTKALRKKVKFSTLMLKMESRKSVNGELMEKDTSH